MSTLNKDNLIFATFGILLGFIAGYLMHEVMVARQPPRLSAGAAATMAQQQAQMGGPAQQGGGQQTADPSAVPPIQEIQQIKDYLKQNPDDPDAIRRLADLDFEMASNLLGDPREMRFWDESRSLYTRYLELRPGDADVLSDLGTTYRGLKQYDEALAHYDKALQANPDHWQSLFNKVVVLALNQRKFAEAEPLLEELQRRQPDNPRVAELAAEVNKQRNAA